MAANLGQAPREERTGRTERSRVIYELLDVTPVVTVSCFVSELDQLCHDADAKDSVSWTRCSRSASAKRLTHRDALFARQDELFTRVHPFAQRDCVLSHLKSELFVATTTHRRIRRELTLRAEATLRCNRLTRRRKDSGG